MLHFAAQKRQLRCEATVLTKPISGAIGNGAGGTGSRIRTQMTTCGAHAQADVRSTRGKASSAS